MSLCPGVFRRLGVDGGACSSSGRLEGSRQPLRCSQEGSGSFPELGRGKRPVGWTGRTRCGCGALGLPSQERLPRPAGVESQEPQGGSFAGSSFP